MELESTSDVLVDTRRPSLLRVQSMNENAAISFPTHRSWAALKATGIIDPEFSYWTQLFQPIFLSCARRIIRSSFLCVSVQPHTLLAPVLETLDLEGTPYIQPLKNAIGMDLAKDVWTSVLVMQESDRPLVQGCNPAPIELDVSFERAIKEIQSDMSALVIPPAKADWRRSSLVDASSPVSVTSIESGDQAFIEVERYIATFCID